MNRSELAQPDWVEHLFWQQNGIDHYLCLQTKVCCGCPRDDGRLNHDELMARILKHTEILCDVRSEVSLVEAHTGSR